MQKNEDGTRYAECETSYIESGLGGGVFTVSYFEDPSQGLIAVDMWRSSGENHWTMTFSDRVQALREYNKWAKVPEEVTT